MYSKYFVILQCCFLLVNIVKSSRINANYFIENSGDDINDRRAFDVNYFRNYMKDRDEIFPSNNADVMSYLQQLQDSMGSVDDIDYNDDDPSIYSTNEYFPNKLENDIVEQKDLQENRPSMSNQLLYDSSPILLAEKGQPRYDINLKPFNLITYKEKQIEHPQKEKSKSKNDELLKNKKKMLAEKKNLNIEDLVSKRRIFLNGKITEQQEFPYHPFVKKASIKENVQKTRYVVIGALVTSFIVMIVIALLAVLIKFPRLLNPVEDFVHSGVEYVKSKIRKPSKTESEINHEKAKLKTADSNDKIVEKDYDTEDDQEEPVTTMYENQVEK